MRPKVEKNKDKKCQFGWTNELFWLKEACTYLLAKDVVSWLIAVVLSFDCSTASSIGRLSWTLCVQNYWREATAGRKLAPRQLIDDRPGSQASRSSRLACCARSLVHRSEASLWTSQTSSCVTHLWLQDSHWRQYYLLSLDCWWFADDCLFWSLSAVRQIRSTSAASLCLGARLATYESHRYSLFKLSKLQDQIRGEWRC